MENLPENPPENSVPENPPGNGPDNNSMKKLVIVLSAVTAAAVIGLIALVVYIAVAGGGAAVPTGRAPAHETAALPEQDPVSAALAAELAGLQAELDALMAEQAAAAPISSAEAEAAATAHVGHGELSGSILFNDEGTLTYEVDIRDGTARYMVYVDAISGMILSMSRFEDIEWE